MWVRSAVMSVHFAAVKCDRSTPVCPVAVYRLSLYGQRSGVCVFVCLSSVLLLVLFKYSNGVFVLVQIILMSCPVGLSKRVVLS